MRLNSIILTSISLLIFIACEKDDKIQRASTAVESITGIHLFGTMTIDGNKTTVAGKMDFRATSDSTVSLNFSFIEEVESPYIFEFSTLKPVVVYGSPYDVGFETTEIKTIVWQRVFYPDSIVHIKGHIRERHLMAETRSLSWIDHFIGDITITIKSPDGLDLVLTIEETSKGN